MTRRERPIPLLVHLGHLADDVVDPSDDGLLDDRNPVAMLLGDYDRVESSFTTAISLSAAIYAVEITGSLLFASSWMSPLSPISFSERAAAVFPGCLPEAATSTWAAFSLPAEMASLARPKGFFSAVEETAA